jgi:Family of unknown function (DUF6157)
VAAVAVLNLGDAMKKRVEGGQRMVGGSTYTDTFIAVATDSKAVSGEIPASRGDQPTVPALEERLLSAHPYRFTHEALILEVHRLRLGLDTAEFAAHESEFRAELFAKPRACMRASSLPKRYGWGVHFDAMSRMAIYALESAEYAKLSEDERVTQVCAMRSSRI